MKPIKKGMTEAVTRDGRKVTQLTWFDTNKEYIIFGVIDDGIFCWRENGRYCNKDSILDIFAPVEYEYQWLVKHKDSLVFDATGFRKTKEECESMLQRPGWLVVSRIEESKREVQE